MKRILPLLILFILSVPGITQSVNIESIRINNALPYRIDLSELVNSGIAIDSIVKVPEFKDTEIIFS